MRLQCQLIWPVEGQISYWADRIRRELIGDKNIHKSLN